MYNNYITHRDDLSIPKKAREAGAEEMELLVNERTLRPDSPYYHTRCIQLHNKLALWVRHLIRAMQSNSKALLAASVQ